ncbi:MlaC/ttg2D family ABC transporter substrate-binding protein [Sphingomonas quercus]|uniref:ABC transporter substrate-binding protein n=1 Tax=Sphingomonas quercus TaxID=2842451 RepID=A0ABS6BGL7_9SPHN|nr:ABC transporter substrate-binding protein [Sphingomonas quercus]MBU3076390.1 ABC transporter substrate-binding protein [Sphingomonas quercus]
MHSFRSLLGAALLSASGLVLPAFVAPAAAAAVDTAEPGKFIETLTDEGFRVLRSNSRDAARGQFRTLLSQYFAIDQIGDRLLGKWRAQITPAQYSAYKAAFPGFLIGTYSDRLYEYGKSDVKVVRVVPRGNSAVVMSQVIQPGAAPITALWTVDRMGSGYQVSNLTVAGINLAVTQAADFDSYIQRNGIDKLIAFMKSRG